MSKPLVDSVDSTKKPAEKAILGIHVPATLPANGPLEKGILYRLPRKESVKITVTPAKGKSFEKTIEVEVARVQRIIPGGYLLCGPKAGDGKCNKRHSFTLTRREVQELQALVSSEN